MSQIVGRRMPRPEMGARNLLSATVGPIDHEGNGAMAVSVYSGISDILIDDTSEQDVTYIGEAIPGSEKSDEVWRIRKITPSSVGYAYNIGEEDFEKRVGFFFRWDDRLMLNYTQ